MEGSENTFDRIFADESSSVNPPSPDLAPPSGSYSCSQQPLCEWGANCTGDHAYSVPSYMTPESIYYPIHPRELERLKGEQEVNQPPKGKLEVEADWKDNPLEKEKMEHERKKPLDLNLANREHKLDLQHEEDEGECHSGDEGGGYVPDSMDDSGDDESGC